MLNKDLCAAFNTMSAFNNSPVDFRQKAELKSFKRGRNVVKGNSMRPFKVANLKDKKVKEQRLDA